MTYSKRVLPWYFKGALYIQINMLKELTYETTLCQNMVLQAYRISESGPLIGIVAHPQHIRTLDAGLVRGTRGIPSARGGDADITYTNVFRGHR